MVQRLRYDSHVEMVVIDSDGDLVSYEDYQKLEADKAGPISDETKLQMAEFLVERVKTLEADLKHEKLLNTNLIEAIGNEGFDVLCRDAHVTLYKSR